MTRDKMIQVILEKARKPCPEIVESRQLEGTDGKWYHAFGFPVGVGSTGKLRLAGFVYRDRGTGTTYGQRYETREAAAKAWEDGQDAARDSFHTYLIDCTAEEIKNKFDFWSRMD